MRKARALIILVLALGLMVCLARVVKAEPMGTEFTYQGQLIDANKPANGQYDIEFKLYDSPTDGNQLASTLDINELDVVDGYFTVELDFGSSVFGGDDRWLETGVRQGALGDPNNYTTLSPRMELTPIPYAVYAAKAAAVPGGTTNYIPKYLQGNKLGNSELYESNGNIGIGTTSPAAKLDVNGTIKASAFNLNGNTITTWPSGGIPSGGIIMWSGSINNIPSGWALCDGTNGTPDLRDKFIVGASQDDSGVAKTNVKGGLMQTGGENSHVLTDAEMPSHAHSIRYKSSGLGTPGDDIFAATVSGGVSYQNTGSTGGGMPHENCPPFYALAFIMKL